MLNSLTKIHANLCRFCARTKAECKQTNKCHPHQDSTSAPINRFSPLDASCPVDQETPSRVSIYSSLCNNSTHDRKGKIVASPLPAPQLIGDTLAEAMELRKAAQVCMRPTTIDDLADLISYRKCLIYYLHRQVRGSRQQWATCRSWLQLS